MSVPTLEMQIASVRHVQHLPGVKSQRDLISAIAQAEKTLEFVRNNSVLIKALFLIEKKAPFLQDFIAAWPDLEVEALIKPAYDAGLIDPETDHERELQHVSEG